MQLLEAFILGITQGLTEFIPVSSSGHLVVLQEILARGADHLFLEFINIGTFLALIIYFRKRIIKILRDVLINKNYRLARNILITSLPAGIVGYLLSDFIAQTPFFTSIVVVTVTLALVGALMIVIEKLPKASPKVDGEDLSALRAFFIGVAQMCALIPGVSRSGATIIAGRLGGLSSSASAEYSFLASLPIFAGVTLKVFLDSADRAYFFENLNFLLFSNLAALISGLIAIKFLLSYLSNHNLALFGWYRIGLAAIISVVLLVQ